MYHVIDTSLRGGGGTHVFHTVEHAFPGGRYIFPTRVSQIAPLGPARGGRIMCFPSCRPQSSPAEGGRGATKTGYGDSVSPSNITQMKTCKCVGGGCERGTGFLHLRVLNVPYNTKSAIRADVTRFKSKFQVSRVSNVLLARPTIH